MSQEVPISHAIVIPDYNFTEWLAAVKGYTNAFERVAIIRSPAGNDLNRFRNITAVEAPLMWFQDDALAHIRRIYPSVVRVDRIRAQTPADLKRALDNRVARSDRYGETLNSDHHIDDRFILEWGSDYRPMSVAKKHLYNNPGMEIATAAGARIFAMAAGTVIRQWSANSHDDALKIGTYVQLATTYRNRDYILTYAGIDQITVPIGAQVPVGHTLGRAKGDRLRIYMQNLPVGSRPDHLNNQMAPEPHLYIQGLRVRPTVDGLRVRSLPNTRDGQILGQINSWDTLEVLMGHDRVLEKVTRENEWIKLKLADGREGYSSSLYLEALTWAETQSVFPGVNLTGINLDIRHPLGKPAPNQLGQLGWLRFNYNVSDNRGSEDIQAAYNRFAPLMEAYVRAGYKIIFTTSHQTYGEGKNEFWPWSDMNDEKWHRLSDRFADMMTQISRQWARSGLVSAWQVWNEQDAPIGASASAPMHAHNYAYMLSKVVPAIRANDPRVKVLTGGHTAGPQRGSLYAKQSINVLKSEARPDGVAFHPYGRGLKLSVPYAIFGTIDDSIEAYSSVIKGKPLWITEWGVLDRNNDSPADVNRYAMEMLNYVHRQYTNRVAAMIWYAWADTMHNGYGLVDRNNQPKNPLTQSFLNFKT